MIAAPEKEEVAEAADGGDAVKEASGNSFGEIAGDMDERRKTAEKIPKSLDATQMYLNEIGFSPLLSADEEKHYARLALDGDEAGRKATAKHEKYLQELIPNCKVTVVDTPEGEDINSLLEGHEPEILLQLLNDRKVGQSDTKEPFTPDEKEEKKSVKKTVTKKPAAKKTAPKKTIKKEDK